MADERDDEVTAKAEADVMGLGVLDAVDVAGTWTVVAEGHAPPAAAEVPAAEDEVPAAEAAAPVAEAARPARAAGRDPRGWLLWAVGGAVAALLLLIGVVAGHALFGPHQAATPPAPASRQGASDRPGVASSPLPKGPVTRGPGVLAPAAQAQPAGSKPVPTPGASGAPTPTPSPSRAPTPTPTESVVPSPGAEISPTAVPAPSPLPTS